MILYHLAVGAGVPPTDPNELEYTYEESLKVLPSFGVVPALQSLVDAMTLPALDLDLDKLLHGEQQIEVHAALAPQAEVSTVAKVTDVFDKGKAALLVLEAATSTTEGTLLVVNRFRLFIRDAGGFGGAPGPPSGNEPPDRAPDLEVERPTLPQQALLYRLCGDKNPLHASPDFARLAGFERPILHGLCTYGIACKAAVDEALGGDVACVGRYSARFAGVVYPGETLAVQMWPEPDRVVLAATVKERGAPVITNAVLELRDGQRR